MTTARRVPGPTARRALRAADWSSVFVKRQRRSPVMHVVALPTPRPRRRVFTRCMTLRSDLRPCCGSRGKRWHAADPTDSRSTLCGRCARTLTRRGVDLAPDTSETFGVLCAEIEAAPDVATLTSIRGRIVEHPNVARLSKLFGARRQEIALAAMRLDSAGRAALMDPKESICLPA